MKTTFLTTLTTIFFSCITTAISVAGDWATFYNNARITLVAIPAPAGDYYLDKEIYGENQTGFMTEYNELRASNYSLYEIETSVINGEVYYSAEMRVLTPTPKYDELIFFNLTQSGVVDKYNQYKGSGYRVLKADVYFINGNERYTLALRKTSQAEGWVLGYAYADFLSKDSYYRGIGYTLTSIETFMRNGARLYNAVWKKLSSQVGQRWVAGYKYQDFVNYYNQIWDQGWRLQSLQAYKVNGQVVFTAVWHPSTRGERQFYNYTYNSIQQANVNNWGWLQSQGWKILSLNIYDVNDENGYANLKTSASADISSEGSAEDFSFSSASFNEESGLYPNPSTGIVNSDAIFNNGGQMEVTVINSAGITVKTFVANSSVLDLQELESGIYTLKLVSDGSIATRKIVIRK